MKFILKLSWRNIWRNKRRSFLTLAAVAFAVFVPELMRGLQVGTFNYNIEHTLKTYSGYLQIQRKGYFKAPSLNKSFHFSNGIKKILNSNENVAGFAPRIVSSDLAAFKNNSLGVMLTGIVPKLELQTSQLTEKIVRGKFLQTDTSANIILGNKLLENLGAKLGDEIVVLAQGLDGSMGNMKFKITGVVSFGSPRLDGKVAFIGLKTAQELLAMYGRVNIVAVRLNSLGKSVTVKETLKSKIKDSSLTVLDWKEFMPGLEETTQLKASSTFLIELILFLIVGFGILNTMLMSVTERYLEFGISLSIGISNFRLAVTIFLEMLMIISIGIVLGNVFGYGLNYHFMHNPILVGGSLKQMYEHYGFLPLIFSSTRPDIFINITIVIVIISIIVSLYPIYKVFRLEPLKGIRYT